jgi:hypothetical protein
MDGKKKSKRLRPHAAAPQKLATSGLDQHFTYDELGVLVQDSRAKDQKMKKNKCTV